MFCGVISSSVCFQSTCCWYHRSSESMQHRRILSQPDITAHNSVKQPVSFTSESSTNWLLFQFINKLINRFNQLLHSLFYKEIISKQNYYWMLNISLNTKYNKRTTCWNYLFELQKDPKNKANCMTSTLNMKYNTPIYVSLLVPDHSCMSRQKQMDAQKYNTINKLRDYLYFKMYGTSIT